MTSRITSLSGRAKFLIAALVFCLGLAMLIPATRAGAGTVDEANAKPSKPISGQVAPDAATPSTATADRPAISDKSSMDVSKRAPLDSEPRKPRKVGTAAECNVADFVGKTGDALVKQIQSVEVGCINSTLFNLTGEDAKGVFSEEQMVTAANALRENAANYPGDNSTKTEQLVVFLRAGYYVQFNNAEDIPEYGPELKEAAKGALDAFYDSSHAFDITEANGNVLSEAVTLIDSAGVNDSFLKVTKHLLTDYNSTYDEFSSMLAAVNNTFQVYFRGHQVPEFVEAVKGDQSHLEVLRDFAVKHDDLLGGDRDYLVYNAGRELGRFLQHADLKGAVTPLAKELLGRSEMTGRTARLWVSVAEMTDEYDKDNCSEYDTCDLAQRIRDAVLTIEHTCGDSLKIAAQELTEEQLSATCDSLTNQDPYFHDVVKDDGPVAGDKNTSLEVVNFDTDTDYQTYATILFDIETNNGGMYLEGDPAKEGNQARFISYEQDGEIWNLNHEYTHYLDGRFNMAGDFAAGQTTPTVMWIEGSAEYIAWSYRDLTNEDAIAEAGKKTHKLSTLFDTTYDNADSTRIYEWGYLAVRYLLQSHPDDVTTLLGHYRTGEWDAARKLLTETIGTSYDADFDAWLDKCAAGDCGK